MKPVQLTATVWLTRSRRLADGDGRVVAGARRRHRDRLRRRGARRRWPRADAAAGQRRAASTARMSAASRAATTASTRLRMHPIRIVVLQWVRFGVIGGGGLTLGPPPPARGVRSARPGRSTGRPSCRCPGACCRTGSGTASSFWHRKPPALKIAFRPVGRVVAHDVEEEPAERRARAGREVRVEHLVGVRRRASSWWSAAWSWVDRRSRAPPRLSEMPGALVGLRRPLGHGVRRDALRVTVDRATVVLLLGERSEARRSRPCTLARLRADRLQEERQRRGRRRRQVEVDRAGLATDLAPVGVGALEDVLELRGRQRRGRRVGVADRRVADTASRLWA